MSIARRTNLMARCMATGTGTTLMAKTVIAMTTMNAILPLIRDRTIEQFSVARGGMERDRVADTDYSQTSNFLNRKLQPRDFSFAEE